MSLADLLNQAEADRWGPTGLGPVLQANQTLIALAPDMARLLIEVFEEPSNSVLSRHRKMFAALNAKAGGTT